MVNKQKRKGTDFERRTVIILNERLIGGLFKRIPASGSMGTSLNEPGLMSDIVGSIEGVPKKFRIECKTGYGGSTQFTLKKEWLDKIQKEADASYSIPLLAGRFSGSRSGVEDFIIMDIKVFCDIMNLITELNGELGKEINDRILG